MGREVALLAFREIESVGMCSPPSLKGLVRGLIISVKDRDHGERMKGGFVRPNVRAKRATAV